MSIESVLEAVRSLPTEDQLRVADAIWENVEGEEFSDEQKREIDRRLAAYEATGKTVTWDEFLTAARARWGR
ncbi:MAG TPA: addiction module protein [Gemmataceae bacterium]|jgi:putative addiction module component (TIGR02574 family)|nr:addiction module protein [Gemmataceae bacterium]